MRTVWIYGLFDPREPDRIRYVGQTSDPQKCLRRHRDGGTQPMRKWVAELLAAYTAPAMRLLQQADGDMAAHLENEWIAHFWKGGLLNAKKKPTQGIHRHLKAKHCALPTPGTTEVRLPPSDDWACLAGIPDELLLKVIEAEQRHQSERIFPVS